MKRFFVMLLLASTLSYAENNQHPQDTIYVNKLAQQPIVDLVNSQVYQEPTNPSRLLISDAEFRQILQEPELDEQYRSQMTLEDHEEIRRVNPKKSYTFINYIAADNDLHYFSWKNIKQMEQVGSNGRVNIIVQLNTPGYFNPTKRYVIKKNKRLLVEANGSVYNQKLNSGSPYTLIDCVKWAVEHYPADEYVLNFWNHGTGACAPGIPRTIDTTELFMFNPMNNMLELDRSIGYLDLIAKQTLHEVKQRGICFDETFNSYISNSDLDFALEEIYSTVLKGKKFAIIGFDACLMSMIEIASIAKKYAHYMVASEEVEYGSGWEYSKIFTPFLTYTPTPEQLAKTIVESYDQLYKPITQDYTLSALDLEKIDRLEEHVNAVATLLVECIEKQSESSAINFIQRCKSARMCTHFDEPSYVDLGHLFNNMLMQLNTITLIDPMQQEAIKQNLKGHLEASLDTIRQAVVINKTGKNLAKAQGIAIYLPENQFSHSYLKNPFTASNNWSLLIAKYLLG